MLNKNYYCKICGKQIHMITGRYRTGLCKSCSHKDKKRPEHSISMKGKNNPNYKDGRTLKQYFCEECNRLISWRQALYRNSLCMFCCNKGEKNPNWKNGKSFEFYSINWTESLKNQIRERDSRRCQICGIKNQSCNHKLSVHHIDYDKENCNEDNLISLCKKCHLKTNFDRDFWRKYFANKTSI